MSFVLMGVSPLWLTHQALKRENFELSLVLEKFAACKNGNDAFCFAELVVGKEVAVSDMAFLLAYVGLNAARCDGANPRADWNLPLERALMALDDETRVSHLRHLSLKLERTVLTCGEKVPKLVCLVASPVEYALISKTFLPVSREMELSSRQRLEKERAYLNDPQKYCDYMGKVQSFVNGKSDAEGFPEDPFGIVVKR